MAGEATNVQNQSLQENLVESYRDLDMSMNDQLFIFKSEASTVDGLQEAGPGAFQEGDHVISGKGLEGLSDGEKNELAAAVKEDGDGKYIKTDFGFKKAGGSEAIVAQSLTQIHLTNRSDILNAISKLGKEILEKTAALMRN